MRDIPIDPYFRVEVLSATLNPQQVAYAAMHQDYAEGFVWDERDQFPIEEKCGEIIVRNLLSGHKGHYGPLEHPQIVFNCGWFPHSVMQQARTHRIASFDVQSFRYSGQRIVDVAEGKRNVEEVFYLRPIGEYSDRQGKRYQYAQEHRTRDLSWCKQASGYYDQRVNGEGFSEEHARGLIPFDVRQHFVVSTNLRALMHFLCIRGKKDAQLEIQQMCELMLPHFAKWCPEVCEYFVENLWLKGRLAP